MTHLWMNHPYIALKNRMFSDSPVSDSSSTPRTWAVGALCRMISQVLNARLNPVAVRGEISGFSRASSGHCYFTLKDEQGQIRCAMFRRVASQVRQPLKDGDQVELTGQLGVYEARGDLQLVVESLRPVGQGGMLEAFLRLKARLELEGLFDPQRKRPVTAMPRCIGVVTSLQAAALQDVLTTLQRRAPHVAVLLSPAQVQGSGAPSSLCAALERLYARGDVDTILLVRGGGSMEDLWAFNDETLARAIVRSPVPLVSGVGHETDFTIADFCADLRAPTPTAAAELCALDQLSCLGELADWQRRLQQQWWQQLDARSQRLDLLHHRLGRPAERLVKEQMRVSHLSQQLGQALKQSLPLQHHRLQTCQQSLGRSVRMALQHQHQRLDQSGVRLTLLDPRQVVQRGYALLQDSSGRAVTRVDSLQKGQSLQATLMDGEVVLTVDERRPGQFSTMPPNESFS